MAFVAATPFQSRALSQSLRTSVVPTKTKMTTAVPSAATLPSRVVLSPLPRLLVYDHCPFCVRARHALGLKNVKYDLVWLANDDAVTPTGLVGKKLVPIFQPDGPSGDAMAESLDICNLVDSDPRFGATGLFKPESGRTDLSAAFDEIAMPLRRLTRIRFSRALLPEFVFADGREAYIRNHPLKEPSSYDENFARSEEYIAAVQAKLDDIAALIFSKEFCTEGGLSLDDIVLFPKLRSMTIIKGLEIPRRMREYLEWQAQVAEIPLYDNFAL